MDELMKFEESDKIFQAIKKTAHFNKWASKPDDLMLIICKALQIGMNVFDAINGGLYAVRGKIEMPSRSMNAIIRAKGHSVTIVESSTTKCVLKGVRSNNKDASTASFTIEEAKLAGLTNNDPWKKYPADMLFARALTRLARQMFADVITDCYIEGELSDPIMPPINEELIQLQEKSPQLAIEQKPNEDSIKDVPRGTNNELMNEAQAGYLNSLIGDNAEIASYIREVATRMGAKSFLEVKAKHFESFEKQINKLIKEKAAK